ncbi:MAG: hypothetical protein HOP96_01395 [Sphingomonas sp.]|nr:hypothetical protein [Sphingomonas sp.]
MAGGRGTQEDVDSVGMSARKLPSPVVSLFKSRGARIVACRDSVTDFETSLRGVTPRGWEGLGRTWDSVPGTYLDGRKSVVIATVAAGGARTVPPRGPNSHGSFDLVLHESMHGFDYLGSHRVLQNPRFVSARTADWANLGGYERQEGRAGLEETYAESASRFFGNDASLAASWPNLRAFWLSAFDEGPEEELVSLPPEEAGGAIGTFHVESDRSIALDLRAEGPDGAVGHAVLTYRPDDPLHARLAKHLAERGEAQGSENLFYPLETTE